MGNVYRALTGLVLMLSWVAAMQRASAQLPDPNQGPGGPILVITSPSSTYGKYYAEILRTEGLNEFAVADIGAVTPATLGSYDVVILAAPMTLTAAQVTHVYRLGERRRQLDCNAPGSATRQPARAYVGGVYAVEWLLVVDTSTPAGNGIVSQPMQFHGVASRLYAQRCFEDRTLYTNPTTATRIPP